MRWQRALLSDRSQYFRTDRKAKRKFNDFYDVCARKNGDRAVHGSTLTFDEKVALLTGRNLEKKAALLSSKRTKRDGAAQTKASQSNLSGRISRKDFIVIQICSPAVPSPEPVNTTFAPSIDQPRKVEAERIFPRKKYLFFTFFHLSHHNLTFRSS